MECSDQKNRKLVFLTWALMSIIVRILLIYFPGSHMLSNRPEISNPLTSLRRLAEGYWLKLSSMSPYAGSMYHGSPLLLSVLGPLTVKRFEGHHDNMLCRLLFVIADFITSVLICAIGQKLQMSYIRNLQSLDILSLLNYSESLCIGDVAALVYLWNPLSIAACVGSSTSPLENLTIILSLYGATTGIVPLASLGWVMATHLSLYPAILIVPIILLLGYGPDAPPAKLFIQRKSNARGKDLSSDSQYLQGNIQMFSYQLVIHFLLWSSVWTCCVLALCSISLSPHGALGEMFKSTYWFILTVEDLSPNIGILWYFFAEVFDFFRNFFLMVFHINILFVILPVAIRIHHRPLFMAFIYITICSLFKSYPSVGDPALYLSLLCLFLNELSDMQFSFFLFCGYVGVFLLSPSMHNLWIWRGTGNANFYFATAMGYACLQIVLLVESISAMLNHDRSLQKLLASKA